VQHIVIYQQLCPHIACCISDTDHTFNKSDKSPIVESRHVGYILVAMWITVPIRTSQI